MDLGRHRLNGFAAEPSPPPAGRRGVRRRARPRQPEQQAAPSAPKVEDILHPLVPDDGLVMGLACDIGTWGVVERQFVVPQAWADRVEETFSLAFVATWLRIPRDDRNLLLTYWRAEPPFRPEGRRGGPSCPRPLIRIDVAEAARHESRGSVESFGRVLSFPVSLVEGDPACLRAEIASTLAATYRQANGEFWPLYMNMVEEPLARWEQRQQTPVTDAAMDRKAKPLERAYLARVRTAIARIVERWAATA